MGRAEAAASRAAPKPGINAPTASPTPRPIYSVPVSGCCPASGTIGAPTALPYFAKRLSRLADPPIGSWLTGRPALDKAKLTISTGAPRTDAAPR